MNVLRLIRHLSLLEELIHDRVAHFWVAVMLHGFGIVLHRALALVAST
jgi:hypothetical protein